MVLPGLSVGLAGRCLKLRNFVNGPTQNNLESLDMEVQSNFIFLGFILLNYLILSTLFIYFLLYFFTFLLSEKSLGTILQKQIFLNKHGATLHWQVTFAWLINRLLPNGTRNLMSSLLAIYFLLNQPVPSITIFPPNRATDFSLDLFPFVNCAQSANCRAAAAYRVTSV